MEYINIYKVYMHRMVHTQMCVYGHTLCTCMHIYMCVYTDIVVCGIVQAGSNNGQSTMAQIPTYQYMCVNIHDMKAQEMPYCLSKSWR